MGGGENVLSGHFLNFYFSLLSYLILRFWIFSHIFFGVIWNLQETINLVLLRGGKLSEIKMLPSE